MQPNASMQPLFNPFSHQIQSNGSTAPLPQQPNMLAVQPQIPYHLGNMGRPPPLIPQSNPLFFPQNNIVGVGHMFPANGQFCNLQSQPHIFPPPPQTLMSPQLGLPFFGNPQFGFGQHQQQQANPSMSLNSGPSQQQHQSWSRSQSQDNSVKYNQGNVSNTNWKSGSGNNVSGNPKRGFQKKSQFHHGNSRQRKFGFRNEQHNTKGYGNERAAKSGQANHTKPPNEKKRSLALTYTDQEIQRWREERRRNYPSKANIEKKLAETPSSSKVTDREAKMRREQLKEILVKQAELGVEVAEIPSHYLSDSETQGYGRKENTRPLNKRGRYRNKHDKRGIYNRKDHATKKQKLLERDSSKTTSSSDKRKPTLLQKLLSKDIRKDKSSLLQVFRFMVMNSFFKDWPEKPLKFPSVTVKESGFTEEVVEDKALIRGKDVSNESSRMMAGNCYNVDKDNKNANVEMKKQNIKDFDDDDDDDNDDVDENNEDDDDDEGVNDDDNNKVIDSIHEEDVRTEEEGEIID